MSSGIRKRGDLHSAGQIERPEKKQALLASFFSGAAKNVNSLSAKTGTNSAATAENFGGGATGPNANASAAAASASPVAQNPPLSHLQLFQQQKEPIFDYDYEPSDSDDDDSSVESGTTHGGSDDEESVTKPGADAIASAENSAASTKNASVSVAC